MDFKRAVEYLLGLHAKAEARMDRADARMDRLDKQMVGVWKLMRAGAKLVAEIGKAQKRTYPELKNLIRTLYQQSGNGRPRNSR